MILGNITEPNHSVQASSKYVQRANPFNFSASRVQETKPLIDSFPFDMIAWQFINLNFIVTFFPKPSKTDYFLGTCKQSVNYEIFSKIYSKSSILCVLLSCHFQSCSVEGKHVMPKLCSL